MHSLERAQDPLAQPLVVQELQFMIKAAVQLPGRKRATKKDLSPGDFIEVGESH